MCVFIQTPLVVFVSDVCLFVCRLFVEILNSCMDCDEIQFKEDGSWAPMRSKKEVQEVSSASYNNGLDGETWRELGELGELGTGLGEEQKGCTRSDEK